MRIVLRIENEDKEFISDFIPGRVFREAVKAQSMLQNSDKLTDEELDGLVMLVVNTYGKQFTVDQFWDGIDARDVMTTIVDTVLGALQRVNDGGSEDTQ
jgi:hypothetical protein